MLSILCIEVKTLSEIFRKTYVTRHTFNSISDEAQKQRLLSLPFCIHLAAQLQWPLSACYEENQCFMSVWRTLPNNTVDENLPKCYTKLGENGRLFFEFLIVLIILKDL